ncbi:MAG: hypothetical protein ACJ74G_04400 [Blastocatellia bacterium]
MSTLMIVVLIVAVAAIAAAVWIYIQKRRTQNLRSRFGPEYDRMIEGHGDRNRAEKILLERQKRVDSFDIKPLPPRDREKFAQRWQDAQSRFVDDPQEAVGDADLLLMEVMKARGYPMGNFEQRAADISVDHPEVVENYRIAHEIALRDRRGEASTEDLRKAMMHYRALFEELLEGYIVAEPQEVRR